MRSLTPLHGHICDASINPCTCGRTWDYVLTFDDGTRVYTSTTVRDRYHALYGTPRVPFVPTSAS
jgi:hypothetical protein